MDNRKVIMFMAKVILNIARSLMRGGIMKDTDWEKMEALEKGDFSAFE